MKSETELRQGIYRSLIDRNLLLEESEYCYYSNGEIKRTWTESPVIYEGVTSGEDLDESLQELDTLNVVAARRRGNKGVRARDQARVTARDRMEAQEELDEMTRREMEYRTFMDSIVNNGVAIWNGKEYVSSGYGDYQEIDVFGENDGILLIHSAGIRAIHKLMNHRSTYIPKKLYDDWIRATRYAINVLKRGAMRVEGLYYNFDAEVLCQQPYDEREVAVFSEYMVLQVLRLIGCPLIHTEVAKMFTEVRGIVTAVEYSVPFQGIMVVEDSLQKRFDPLPEMTEDMMETVSLEVLVESDYDQEVKFEVKSGGVQEVKLYTLKKNKKIRYKVSGRHSMIDFTRLVVFKEPYDFSIVISAKRAIRGKIFYKMRYHTYYANKPFDTSDRDSKLLYKMSYEAYCARLKIRRSCLMVRDDLQNEIDNEHQQEAKYLQDDGYED